MTIKLAPGKELPPTNLPVVGRAEIQEYLIASGDVNRLHRDPDFAKSAGFKDILSPGMLIMGQTSIALTNLLPKSEIQSLTCRFTQPVVCGEQLVLNGRVAASRPANLYILRLKVESQNGLTILGEAIVRTF